jgi:hypothetical protein
MTVIILSNLQFHRFERVSMSATFFSSDPAILPMVGGVPFSGDPIKKRPGDKNV